MRVNHPTHVVSIGVWDPQSGTTVFQQCWVDVGPFPKSPLPVLLLQALSAATQGHVEVVEARTSTTSAERREPAPWEQLPLFH